MQIVSGIIEVHGDDIDKAMAAASAMAQATREEDGCITYAFYQDIENPGRFRVYEEWDDLDCLKAHGKSPHIATYRQKLGEIGAFGRDIKMFEPGPMTGL